MVALLTLLSVSAQEDSFEAFRKQINQQFDKAKHSNDQRFDNFRQELNAQYADFLSKSWGRFKAKEALPAPAEPDPVVPPVFDPQEASKPREIPFSSVTPVTPVAPQPEPVEPIKPTPAPQPKPQPQLVPTPQPQPTEEPTTEFDFFGLTCEVKAPVKDCRLISSMSEQNIAEAWRHLSQPQFDAMLADCLAQRKSLTLGDWAYYQFIKRFADAHCKGCANDSVLFQAFILTQSGYQIRLGRTSDRLYLLVACNELIYGRPYFTLNDVKFYPMYDDGARPSSLRICEAQFPSERCMSLYFDKQPRLAHKPAAVATFASKAYANIKAEVAINRNLMEFYATYPQCSYPPHVIASLSESLKAQLYPTLRKAVEGKSQRDAANCLINFVQTGFDYKTDTEQFGCEKWYFGDEIFFYPYSDCDDRAIFFAVLMREILGLEVVLIDYPGHVATAVQFTEAIEGDYITYKGKRYTICDPTYIGASIGRSMPDYKSAKIDIIEL